MPPTELAPIPLPLTRGEDALAYLAHVGLHPRTPPSLRASDYTLCLSNPFLYFLVRRLGLVPALSWSKAKNQGTWFHHLFALFDNPDRYTIYARMLDTRITELKVMCKELRISDEARAHILDREQQDAAEARAYFEATEECPIPRDGKPPITFQEYLRDGRWIVVGRELRYSYVHPDYRLVPIVVTFDLLLYHPTANELWIVDAKTTSSPCTIRLSTIAHEFQTQQYMVTADSRLEDLARQLKLPIDVRLGGMIHPCIWKPNLRFGQRDRDCRWTSEGKRSGKSGTLLLSPKSTPSRQLWSAEWGPTGKITHTVDGNFDYCFHQLWDACDKKPEKVYFGEPSYPNYVSRMIECYRAEGDYAEARDERMANPPVNMSTTSAARLHDGRWLTEYWDRVHYLYEHATCDPIPSEFLRNIDALHSHSRLSPYADFFLTEVEMWPEVIARNSFMTAHRDEDIDITPLTEEST